MAGGRRPRTASRFLYLAVAGELRDRIKRGVYGPGQQIPTETELVREFRVSTITVRRAILDLVLAGVLHGRRGAGVFVRSRRRIMRRLSGGFSGPIDTVSIGDVIRRAGEEPAVREISLRLVKASAVVAERLQVKSGERVYRHEKIVLADGEAVGVDIAYLPRPLGDSLRARIARDFIYPSLRAEGVTVASIDFTLEGDSLSAAEGEMLGLPAGFPVLVVGYTPLGVDGRPLLTGRLLSRGDRFTYAFRLRLEGEGEG